MKRLCIFFLALACICGSALAQAGFAYAIEAGAEGQQNPVIEQPAQPNPAPNEPQPQVEQPVPAPNPAPQPQPNGPAQNQQSNSNSRPQASHPNTARKPVANQVQNSNPNDAVNPSGDGTEAETEAQDETENADTEAQDEAESSPTGELTLLSKEDRDRSHDIAETDLKHFKSQWLPIALASGFICVGFIVVALAKRQYSKRRK